MPRAQFPLVVLVCLAALPTTAAAQTNVFGYTLAPTPYDYVAPPGTAVGLNLGDDDAATVTLPFAFDYYGVTYNQVEVQSNGGINFLPGTFLSTVADCLPAPFGSDIHVYWDDVNPASGGDVFTWRDLTGTNDRFVISWEAIPLFLGNNPGTYQIQLHSDGHIELHWQDTNFGDSSQDHGADATIGIQDVSGGLMDELEVSCLTASTLESTGVSFSTCSDGDGDGYDDLACGGDDCDDGDVAINPGVLDLCANGLDEDCSGADDPTDADGDGYLNDACVGGDDCNDGSAAINPGVDADGDGANVCLDCNDAPGAGAFLFPGNVEVCGDGVDQDCSGADDPVDGDGDGYGGVPCGGDDCDDTDSAINPGVDFDGDGSDACLDCDDAEPDALPGGVEVCDGGIDNDCDGAADDVDADGDGELALPCGGTDCDDDDALVGAGTDADVDGSDACADCDDALDTIYPGAPELCDGVDSDCDGFVDGQDLDVGASVALDADLEQNDGGLVASAPSGSTSLFAYGVPTSGPNGAFSGTKVWATVLNGNYGVNNNTAYLDFPPLALPAGAPTFTFAYWQDNESNCAWDFTTVQIDVGTGWANLPDGDGCAGGLAETFGVWETVEIDLSAWAGQSVSIRFVHTTDTSNANYPGVYIDDLQIVVLDDADGDGWVTCSDCDDADFTINPDTAEVCADGIDQDCDGVDPSGDLDGDGYVDADCGGDDCDDGDAAINPSLDGDGDGANVCDDCDDADDTRFPGNPELCGDGLDQDCSGSDDSGDLDDDGFLALICLSGDDCDDGNAAVFPGAFDQDGDGFEVCADCYELSGDTEALVNPAAVEQCDGLDNDCDGVTDDVDEDGDGFSAELCGGSDCDDSDPAVHPQVDADSDGFHACVDCNEADPTVFPGAIEICDDGLDQSCTFGDLVGDGDGDGHDSAICGGEDCDDTDAAFHPDATEICDGVDLDCDGLTSTVDADGDGFFDLACGGLDCDDASISIHPDANEVCDGVDNNCDGALIDGGEADADADGVPACADDCDDADASSFPGADELCDELDNDCDGIVDNGVIRDGDEDGFERQACGGQDCDDRDSTAVPGGTEDCADGADNDCDGGVDDADDDCASTNGCACTSRMDGASGGAAPSLAALIGLVAIARRRARGQASPDKLKV